MTCDLRIFVRTLEFETGGWKLWKWLVQHLETILINFPIVFVTLLRRITPEIASTVIAHGYPAIRLNVETG